MELDVIPDSAVPLGGDFCLWLWTALALLADMLRRILVALGLAGLSWQAPTTTVLRERDPYGPLQFGDDGYFQLSIFEDLHFGENAWDQWGPQQDINTLRVMGSVLDSDRPDLVIFNGDLVTGENTFLDNSTTYVDMLVGPLVERGLTWASTYGNHDHQPNISGATILARERTWPGSRTQQMVPGRDAGTSNYYLPVYGSDCDAIDAVAAGDEDACAPALLLWLFDSRGGYMYQEWEEDGSQVKQPNWVDYSVVDWFQQTNAELVNRHQRVIPSLAFTHIPTQASHVLQRESPPHPNYHPGIDDDFPIAQQAQGWCPDGTNDGTCSYGGQDVPFMQALATTPGLVALFSGHDHGDTWCYRWEGSVAGLTVEGTGVHLCFGQHSGYGGYGNWIRGARQVRVSEEALQHPDEQERIEVETWIRLESGAMVGSVKLGKSYGQEWYPATPNDKTYCPTCEY